MARVYRSVEGRAHGMLGLVPWEIGTTVGLMLVGFVIHPLGALLGATLGLGGAVLLRRLHAGRRNWLAVRMRGWREPAEFSLAVPEVESFKPIAKAARR